MKKLSIILMALLMATLLSSCKNDEVTDKNDVDLSDPTLSITECYDVPYQYDLSEYIEISADDYIGVEIPKVDASVSDDDVNDAIFADLQQFATYTVVERPAANGDTLTLDFTGSVDGVEFDGGAATDYEMVLGSAGFIDGFEEAIVGHAAGEEFVIDVTFPEDYGNEELKGKAAQFAINLKKVEEQILPEFNLDFVKKNFNCDTIEAYLALKQEELIAFKAEEAELERKSSAFYAIYEKINIKKYPQDMFNYYYNDIVEFFKSLAKDNLNMDLETFITDYSGSTEEEFYKYVSETAATNVEQELICFSIANEQKLWQNLKKADYDAYIAELAEEQGVTIAQYEQSNGSDIVWTSLIIDKALDFIVANAVEVDTETETTETESAE